MKVLFKIVISLWVVANCACSSLLVVPASATQAQAAASTAQGGMRGYRLTGSENVDSRRVQLRPAGVAARDDGTIYVTDVERHSVFAVGTDGQISRIAGNDYAECGGDGEPARWARLNNPMGVAFSEVSETLYIADTYNHRIRAIGPDGYIRTIAGTGTAGFSGDGSDALYAQLDTPMDVAVDPEGNLYIADSKNDRIRRVDQNGHIKTIAGTRVQTATQIEGALANTVRLDSPRGVALGRDGSVYISDSMHHRVLAMSPRGIIRTVAGNGTAGFSGDGQEAIDARLNVPHGLAVNDDGTVFVSDTNNHRIRSVGLDGKIATFAGTGTPGSRGDGGPASVAELNMPSGLAAGPASSLLIADQSNDRLRQVDLGGFIQTVAGGTTDSIALPWGVSPGRDGSIYIADPCRHRVWLMNPDGSKTLVAGTGRKGFSGDGGDATKADLNGPDSAAMGRDGTIYIADKLNHRVRAVSTNGSIRTIAGTGGRGSLGIGGLATLAQLAYPGALAVGEDGTVYIADRSNHRVVAVSGGIIRTIAGTGIPGFSQDATLATDAQLSSSEGVAVDPTGNVYISDTQNDVVRRVAKADGLIWTVAGIPNQKGFSGDHGQATHAKLCRPSGLAFGPNETIVVTDSGNGKVRSIERNGTISTLVGSGLRVLASDSAKGRFTAVRPDGTIRTVTGADPARFWADGHGPLETSMDTPASIAIDPSTGATYISDVGSHCVWVFCTAGPLQSSLDTRAASDRDTSARHKQEHDEIQLRHRLQREMLTELRNHLRTLANERAHLEFVESEVAEREDLAQDELDARGAIQARMITDRQRLERENAGRAETGARIEESNEARQEFTRLNSAWEAHPLTHLLSSCRQESKARTDLLRAEAADFENLALAFRSGKSRIVQREHLARAEARKQLDRLHEFERSDLERVENGPRAKLLAEASRIWGGLERQATGSQRQAIADTRTRIDNELRQLQTNEALRRRQNEFELHFATTRWQVRHEEAAERDKLKEMQQLLGEQANLVIAFGQDPEMAQFLEEEAFQQRLGHLLAEGTARGAESSAQSDSSTPNSEQIELAQLPRKRPLPKAAAAAAGPTDMKAAAPCPVAQAAAASATADLIVHTGHILGRHGGAAHQDLPGVFLEEYGNARALKDLIRTQLATQAHSLRVQNDGKVVLEYDCGRPIGTCVTLRNNEYRICRTVWLRIVLSNDHKHVVSAFPIPR